MSEPARLYSEKLSFYADQLQKVSAKVKRFAWYRFIAFVGIFLPLIILGWDILTLYFTVPLVVVFFFLVKRNIGLEKTRKMLQIRTKILEDELKALEHSFLHFESGKKFLDVDHPFAYDLDLFGEGSLFQYLNRTSTVGGKNLLGSWLKNPLRDKKQIELRQEAVRELAEMPLWRLNFLTEGNLFAETKDQFDEIRTWSEMDLELEQPVLVKWLVKVLPVLTLLALIPAIA